MKMRTNKKRSLSIITGIIVVLIGCAYIFTNTRDGLQSSQHDKKSANQSSQSNNTPNTTAPPSQEEVKAGNQQKEQTTADQPQTTTFKATITALNKSPSTLQIRTLIDTVTEGTCTLYLEKDTTKITRVATIQPLASTSTCKGFNIPLTDLAAGNWSVKIIVNSSTSSQTLNDHVTI